MSAIETVSLNHRPLLPERRDMGIGIVGAGFIVRDCHLVAYVEAGFRVAGITSRSIDKAREVAASSRIASCLRVARADAGRSQQSRSSTSPFLPTNSRESLTGCWHTGGECGESSLRSRWP